MKKLSEHFCLSEFEYSSTAIAHGIDNRCPSNLIPNLENLCEKVLEPLRMHFDVPVVITSGYRCHELNQLVGGVNNSMHLTGRAADICHQDKRRLYEWYCWLHANCHCCELIWEKRANTRWIHVSI